MKRLSLILFLFFCTTASWSQEKVYENSTSIGFDGKWSSFGDNYDDLDKWITKNRIYPQEAIDKQEQGRVDISFIVEKDGSLSSIEIKNSVSPSLDAEAVRLASTMPKWKCAYNYGVPCRSRNQFSVNFRLPKVVSKPQAQTGTIQSQHFSDNGHSTSDEWLCKNGQKIYEGEYLFGNIKGKAKYQYRDNADGTRCYDGNFEFFSEGFYAKGKFSNDCQIGTWKYNSNSIVASINFDENGYLEDDFSYIKNNRNVYNGNVTVEGKCEEGCVRTISFKCNAFIAEGQFFSARNTNYGNHPVGTWKLTILNDPNHQYTYESNSQNKPMTIIFNEEGHVKDWFFIDPSTGDKKSPQRGSFTLNGPEGIMRYILEDANQTLRIVLMKKSIQKNKY